MDLGSFIIILTCIFIFLIYIVNIMVSMFFVFNINTAIRELFTPKKKKKRICDNTTFDNTKYCEDDIKTKKNEKYWVNNNQNNNGQDQNIEYTDINHDDKKLSDTTKNNERKIDL
jgi:hypothetical protein